MADLLPPNATDQERALSEATGRLGAVPVEFIKVWNPLTCPVQMLPWLAWALSVDTWNPAWSVTTKRAVINASIATHRKKGTIGALRTALSAFALNLDVQEWWQFSGAPYTFRVAINVDGASVTDEQLDELEAVVNAVKNARSHLDSLTATTAASFQVPVWAAVVQASDITTVYPK
jgi:phage tail P2-like protein